jgi:hypothetical protein
MRCLAHRLLTYEVDLGTIAAPSESATLRVYEKLRQGLVEFAGVAAFQSLASRALTIARTEAPSLSAARVAADGTLQGLGEVEHPMDMDTDQAGEVGVILIARLLCLLNIFLGESLTLGLLRVTWPREALEDCNSENERTT